MAQLRAIEEWSTSDLVVTLQKLAKNGSYLKPGFRSAVLTEAAKRLQAYRNTERGLTCPEPE